jgi:hypothetical protein
MTAVATAGTSAAQAPPSTMTVTEALAEIKTLGKRIQKRRENVLPYLWRQEFVADPMAKNDVRTSTEFIRRELQGAKDLEERLVNLRVAIQAHNQVTQITVDGETRSVAGWLTWRKEVLPGVETFLGVLRKRLDQMRADASQKHVGVVNVSQSVGGQAAYNDVVVNLDEGDLARQVEHLELVKGTLDGQLSLVNATTTITI